METPHDHDALDADQDAVAAVTPLAFPFDRDRFRHVLLERVGDVCLVERTNLVTSSVHWEVVVLQHEPEKTIRGRLYPAHERYPAGEEWGTHGWTYTTVTDARRKWGSLEPRRPQTGGRCAEDDPLPSDDA